MRFIREHDLILIRRLGIGSSEPFLHGFYTDRKDNQQLSNSILRHVHQSRRSHSSKNLEIVSPNISGMLNNLVSNSATESTVTGELLRWQSRQDVGYAAKTATGGFLFDPLIDASRANSLYGNASSLQPASVRIFALIRAY